MTEADRNPPAVILDHASFSYSRYPALHDVSLSAAPGETIALVGPSGAGKTTLLRLIAGMFSPTSGTVTVHGRSPSSTRDRRERSRLVGMVQQRLDLVPQLSVRHNVEAGMLGRWGLWRSLAGLFFPIEHASSRDAIAQVGLSNLSGQRVSRLSGGEQQRVAIARALAQDPLALVADEPVSSLDPTLARHVLDSLTEVAKSRGKTVIASLHTPEMARDHFDRVIGVKDGRTVFDVKGDELSQALLDTVYRGSGHTQTGVETAIDGAAAATQAQP